MPIALVEHRNRELVSANPMVVKLLIMQIWNHPSVGPPRPVIFGLVPPFPSRMSGPVLAATVSVVPLLAVPPLVVRHRVVLPLVVLRSAVPSLVAPRSAVVMSVVKRDEQLAVGESLERANPVTLVWQPVATERVALVVQVATPVSAVWSSVARYRLAMMGTHPNAKQKLVNTVTPKPCPMLAPAELPLPGRSNQLLAGLAAMVESVAMATAVMPRLPVVERLPGVGSAALPEPVPVVLQLATRPVEIPSAEMP